MMSGLTTHILDLTHGKPAANVAVRLYKFEDSLSDWKLLEESVTNGDGRLDAPLLSGEEMKIGVYQLIFSIGSYFRSQETKLPEPPFLEEVPVQFGISDPSAHYHIPLLVSPWGYQLYRGS
ncbi:5-hydroxyisourate hydrolase [Weizmannia acidilactici]|uniref:5-hydroxyisourate hydrolase n=2 Tax=Weizmannia acidilactici TaxID=2607726 RepID=A0A5J4JH32_9BACI|nr:5-hydroxyisourate hydrolase [Weizmannia acidilactici]GER73684.1 5-hydroxyisourate hydrolase [Weizmannia acidilactici]